MQLHALHYSVYTCHKQVRAFKIEAVESVGDGTYELTGEGCVATVDQIWVNKHAPEDSLHSSAFIGGYFILYPDGCESWSPGQAFSEGYTKNPEVTDVNPRGSVHPDDPAA